MKDNTIRNYRMDIQGLRAVAVLLVFIFHMAPQSLSGGFVGVDIFFVISGYLISGIILQKKAKNSFRFIDFYLSRFKRLLPAYFAFLVATLLASAFIYLPIDIFNIRNGAMWSAFFSSNIYLSKLDTYFGASSSENPLLHTWTLAIEMQFYFILPFLLYFIKNKFLNRLLVVLVIILFGYSFANTFWLPNKNLMYFSLLARMPEFLLGTLAAVNQDSIEKILSKAKNFWSLFSLVAILVSSYLFSEKISFPGAWVLIPCLATVVLLTVKNSAVSKSLSNKHLVFIGEISYSVYLWHWPVMAMMRYMNDRKDFTLPEMVIVTLMTAVLSLLSYKFIEKKARLLPNKKFIIGLCGALGALGLLTLNINRINKNVLPIPREYIAPVVGLDSHGSTFKTVETFGDTSKPNDSILLIGDSNALAYKNFFDKLGKAKGFNFKTITNDIYPNIPGIAKKEFSSKMQEMQYEDILKNTADLLKNSKTIIFISAYSKEVPSITPAVEALVKNSGNHKNFIFVTTFPLLSNNPIKINRGYMKKGNKDNNYQITYKEIPAEIKQLHNSYKNVHVVTIDYPRWHSVELPFKNGKSLYYDERHLNTFGTTVLFEDFGEDVYRQMKPVLEQK